MKKILYATLYQQFFDQIARGTKTTEYRQMSDYWIKRLLVEEKYNGMTPQEIRDGLVMGKLKPYWEDWTHIRFKCGNNYLLCEIKGFAIYRGHDIFCIKLGKTVNISKDAEE